MKYISFSLKVHVSKFNNSLFVVVVVCLCLFIPNIPNGKYLKSISTQKYLSSTTYHRDVHVYSWFIHEEGSFSMAAKQKANNSIVKQVNLFLL